MPDAPIHVDFLDLDSHGLPGRLGLTVAPGRWRAGLDSASDTLVRDDLLQLRDVHGAKVLVTLLEDFEMTKLGISQLLPTAKRLRLQSIWFPIPDMTAPSDVAATVALVEAIVGHMAKGETVVVHCRGGLGRSGTVAACVLVARGRSPHEAIRLVRSARPGAVEMADQEAFVARNVRPLRTFSPGGDR